MAENERFTNACAFVMRDPLLSTAEDWRLSSAFGVRRSAFGVQRSAFGGRRSALAASALNVEP